MQIPPMCRQLMLDRVSALKTPIHLKRADRVD